MCASYKAISFSSNIFYFKAKSPVFTHISATLEGLSTVRAFHAENILEAEFEDHQDLNTGTLFMFIGMLVIQLVSKQTFNAPL